MSIEFLADYMIPVIIGLCLAVGYIVKHWIRDADNKIIPTVVAIVGLVVAIWMHWGHITPTVILSGLASGLVESVKE